MQGPDLRSEEKRPFGKSIIDKSWTEQDRILGSDCGSVGRAVASVIRGQQFN